MLYDLYIDNSDMFGVSSMGNFSQQIMTDPMLSAAKQIGSQFAEQQKEKVVLRQSIQSVVKLFKLRDNFTCNRSESNIKRTLNSLF